MAGGRRSRPKTGVAAGSYSYGERVERSETAPLAMHRRHLLRRAGIATASAMALAGCTDAKLKEAEAQPPLVEEHFHEEELDLPVSRKFEEIAAEVSTADEAEIEDPDGFEAYLDEQGVSVEALEETVVEGEPHLSLEYVDSGEEGTLSTLGVVAGGYAVLVEAGHESEALEATLLDPARREFGEFEIVRDWAEEYNEGAISAEKYGGLVSGTLESK